MSNRRYALIATTEPATGEVLTGLVVAHGVAPVVVRDGDAAVAVLREQGVPAITIVDLSLPRLDGFGVIRALRSVTGAAAAPVVAMSSILGLRTRAMDLRHSLGIGAVLSMQLPVSRIDQLLAPLLSRGGTTVSTAAGWSTTLRRRRSCKRSSVPSRARSACRPCWYRW